MFDMMLGPLGQSYWVGSSAMPRARFHYDYSRVAFAAAATIQPLYAFSYAIGDQQPAAITAAIGATQADIFDTSLSKADSMSKTCIATHMGITMDRTCLVNAADVLCTLAATQVARPRLVVRLFWAERTNEETVGMLDDYPEGIGTRVTDWTNATAYTTHTNGIPVMSNIKALPKPLPCKGGDTYVRVAFEPSVRDGGVNFATITGFTARIYGVAPAKEQPGEAPKKALQALAALQAAL